MTENTTPTPAPPPLALNQQDVDRIVRERTARVRAKLTATEAALADAHQDAQRWEIRAKSNLALIDELRRLNADLLDRLDGTVDA